MKYSIPISIVIIAGVFTVGIYRMLKPNTALSANLVTLPVALPSPTIDIGICCGAFKSESYLEVTAALQAMPEAQRIAQLRAWAAVPGERKWECAFEQQVVVLCCMLFEPKPGVSYYGGATIGSEQAFFTGASPTLLGHGQLSRDNLESLYPLCPITLVNGIPFLIVTGYSQDLLIGYSASKFLEFSLKNLTWTTHHYIPVKLDVRMSALDTLVNHGQWQKALDQMEIEFLSDQTGSYEPPPIWINSTELSSQGPEVKATHEIIYNRDRDYIQTLIRLTGMKKFDDLGFGPPGSDRYGTHHFSEGNSGMVLTSITEKISGGTSPLRWMLSLFYKGQNQPKIVAQGMGKGDVHNPFLPESFTFTWPGLTPTAQLQFTVVDSKGSKIAQLIQITAPNEIDIHTPNSDLLVDDPLLKQLTSTAKDQKDGFTNTSK